MNRRIANVINSCDILIEVIDARCPNETINKEIEQLIKKKRKQMIRAISKVDLIPKWFAKEIAKKMNGFFVSSKNKTGIKKLLTEIERQAGKKEVYVGIIGYPNTGKSFLTNALKGRKKVSVGPKPGHTRGQQFIRLKEGIMLVDSPGTIEKGYLFAQMPEKMVNPSIPAVYLIKKNISKVKKFYSIDGKNPNDVLEEIKKKRNYKDTDDSARRILYDWNAGRLNIFWI